MGGGISWCWAHLGLFAFVRTWRGRALNGCCGQLLNGRGVLWWWTHLGPFAFARDVAGVGARRVLQAVMRWEGGIFVVLDSPGLVTACAFVCDVAGMGLSGNLWEGMRWGGSILGVGDSP